MMATNGGCRQICYKDGLRPREDLVLRLYINAVAVGAEFPCVHVLLGDEDLGGFGFRDESGSDLATLAGIDEERLNDLARLTVELDELRGISVVGVGLEVLGVSGVLHWKWRFARRLFEPF